MMGKLSRTYSGEGSLVGLVVADGLTAGSCVACDGTSEPIGICISQAPNGLCDIATQGETAFAVAGDDIAFDSSNFATCDSNGKVITFNPATTEDAVYQIGLLTRPTGAVVAAGALVEVAINIAHVPAVGGD